MKLANLFIALTLISVPAVAQTGPKSLPAVKSQADFNSISVVYDANTPYALPHVMFVIDRKGNVVFKGFDGEEMMAAVQAAL